MPVHVLTGRSGLGKSAAIVRPLRWLVTNRPTGDSFRKWGSEETRVTAWFDDDTGHLARLEVMGFQCHSHLDIPFSTNPPENWTVVSRIRSNKRNCYEMWRKGGKVEVYQIGSNKRVPEPVAAYLNMGEINFQSQHDPIYLLGLNRTPFELARVMNGLAGLGELDEAMGRMNGRYKKEKGVVDAEKAKEEVLLGKLEDYEGIGELEIEVAVAASLESQARGLREQVGELSDLYRRAKESEGKGRRLEGVVGLGDLATLAEDSYNRGRQARDDAQELRGVGEKWEKAKEEGQRFQGSEELERRFGEVEREYAEHKTQIEKARREAKELWGVGERWEEAGGRIEKLVCLPLLAEKMVEVERLRGEVEEARRMVEEFTGMAGKMSDALLKLTNTQDLLRMAREKWDALAGEMCPTCGKEIEKIEGKGD